MENKVLVTINIPSLEKKYDFFLPVNRRIYNVVEMIKKCLCKLSQEAFDVQKQCFLYNAETGIMYDMNALVRNTDIRNGSIIILL